MTNLYYKKRRRRRQRGGSGGRGLSLASLAADFKAHAVLHESKAHQAQPEEGSKLPLGDGIGPWVAGSNKPARAGPWAGAVGARLGRKADKNAIQKNINNKKKARNYEAGISAAKKEAKAAKVAAQGAKKAAQSAAKYAKGGGRRRRTRRRRRRSRRRRSRRRRRRRRSRRSRRSRRH